MIFVLVWELVEIVSWSFLVLRVEWGVFGGRVLVCCFVRFFLVFEVERERRIIVRFGFRKV